MSYLIFRCPHCGLYLYAQKGQKSMKCLDEKCGKRIRLNVVKVIREVDSPNTATYIIGELKKLGKSVGFQSAKSLLGKKD